MTKLYQQIFSITNENEHKIFRILGFKLKFKNKDKSLFESFKTKLDNIDDCSMGVIYKDFENEILETIYNNFLNEKEIIEDIVSNKSIKEIITERGSF